MMDAIVGRKDNDDRGIESCERGWSCGECGKPNAPAFEFVEDRGIWRHLIRPSRPEIFLLACWLLFFCRLGCGLVRGGLLSLLQLLLLLSVFLG